MASPTDARRTLRKGLAARRRHRLRRRLQETWTLLASIVLAYAIYWLWSSPAWAWHGSLDVMGNRIVPREEILARLSLPPGMPLFRIDPAVIRRELTTEPAIAHVVVRRWLFPARLEVMVLERQPLAAIAGFGDRWLDGEGTVFIAPKALVKPACGVRIATALEPGGHLPSKLMGGMITLLESWPKPPAGSIRSDASSRSLDATTRSQSPQPTETKGSAAKPPSSARSKAPDEKASDPGLVDVTRLSDVYAEMGGTRIRLGDLTEVPRKLGLVRHLMPLASKYGDRLEYIDVRFPKNPSLKLKSGEKLGAMDEPATDAATIDAAPTKGPSAPP